MPSAESASQHRLDSWKEIAVYLKREVRTVQRWEAKEGLPVHRHLHDTQVTVYAYSTELDDWLAKRRPAEENGDSVVVVRPVSRLVLQRKALLSSGAVLLLLVIAVVWVRDRAVGARLGFQARDWVLLAGFENRTGESLFDGTLQYALQRELGNSHFVNIVPCERAEDALRLMRKTRAYLMIWQEREVVGLDRLNMTVELLPSGHPDHHVPPDTELCNHPFGHDRVGLCGVAGFTFQRISR